MSEAKNTGACWFWGLTTEKHTLVRVAAGRDVPFVSCECRWLAVCKTPLSPNSGPNATARAWDESLREKEEVVGTAVCSHSLLCSTVSFPSLLLKLVEGGDG